MAHVDVYMFPCPTCGTSAASQVQSAVNYLRSHNTKFGMFWLEYVIIIKISFHMIILFIYTDNLFLISIDVILFVFFFYLKNTIIDEHSIEGTQYWSSSQSTNQAFFNGLVSEARAMGVTLGVYTSASQWNPIMGSGFTGGAAYPLWYAHYDNNPSFSDFSPFGGWTKPNIKQYQGDVSTCGAGVDLNYYP